MSTENQDADAVNAKNRFEKNIMLTVYLQDEDFEDAREAIDSVFDYDQFYVDPFETETTEHTDVSLNFDFAIEDDDGYEHTFSKNWEPFGSYTQKNLRRAIEKGIIETDDLDWVSAEINEYEETSHTAGLSTLLEKPLKPKLESIPMEDLGYTKDSYTLGLIDWEKDVQVQSPDAALDEEETLKTRVTANGNDIEQRRVLKPQDDRVQGDRYEDDDERWSFQVVIDIEAVSQEELDNIERALGLTITDYLSNLDGVAMTRLEDCEVVTTESGSCHNV